MGSDDTVKKEDYCVVVMGSSKIGKTTFVKHLLRLNDGADQDRTWKIDNLFEYREYTLDKSFIYGTKDPTLRGRAIDTGNLFVLLFSVAAIETFEYATQLRNKIVAQKGNDVTIIFVGLQGNTKHRHVLYAFDDLVTSCFPESKYCELSFSDETDMATIYDGIVRFQQDFYEDLKTRTRGRSNSITDRLYKLFSAVYIR